MIKFILHSFLLGLTLFLTACAGSMNPVEPSGEWDLKTAYMIPGWRSFSHTEDNFPIKGAIRKAKSSSYEGPLYVYIEGDAHPELGVPNIGFGDVTRRVFGFDVPSLDVTFDQTNTTPARSIALRMALTHEDDELLYLGQPCQYYSASIYEQCSAQFWQKERFSEAAVLAISRAITAAKDRNGHDRPVILIGHAHGGTLATLVASLRRDVIGLITVASILAVDSNQIDKGQSPLFGSLDPQSLSALMTEIPHFHYSGADDEFSSPANAELYAASLGAKPLFWHDIRQNADHFCCWDEEWPKLFLAAMLKLEQHARPYSKPVALTETRLAPLPTAPMQNEIVQQAPPPKLPGYSGQFVVQVGAYLRPVYAEAHWQRLKRYVPGLKASPAPIKDQYTDSKGRQFTRIYATRHDDKSAANKQCRVFKNGGQDCWVHKVP